MLTQGFIVGLWAWLFVGKLRNDGELFGWLSAAVYHRIHSLRWGRSVYKAAFGCACCHAGWLSIGLNAFYFYAGQHNLGQAITLTITAMACGEILTRQYD